MSDGVDPDYTEGSELTYLHGVAYHADAAVPADLDVIAVPAGTWVVWFPSNPWRLRPGPSIVAVLDRSADFSTATTELWFPVERS